MCHKLYTISFEVYDGFISQKILKLAQNQPKSQFLFHKNLSPRDFTVMTLGASCSYFLDAMPSSSGA